MKRFLVVAVFFALLTGAFAENPVWQLGTPDGSEREFTPHYNAWEYGDAPAIRNSPAMDHKTHTFRYEIKENKSISRPQIVSGLAAGSAQNWMKADEIVTGLRLTWKETQAGNRKLVVDLAKWTNPLKGRDGIELELPTGGRKLFDLPDGGSRKDTPLTFSAVFPVKAGSNTLTFRIVSMSKHYRVQFDRIALYPTDKSADVLPPVLKREFSAQDGIYHPGDRGELRLRVFNLPDGRGTLNYRVEDVFGKTIANGSTGVKEEKGVIALPTAQYGYFKVKSWIGKTSFTTSYAVIEPVKAEYIEDSRFGCHALETDGYRLRSWPEVGERRMRRAFLAGAKWVRHHSMHWFLREPEKGKFDWTYFDDRLSLAEKYKMNVLLTFTETPKWASASNNTKMTVCGTFYYQNHPPKDWRDWADFVSAVVTRYKNKIHWYELWNEPDYSSAFWTNGSAKDYAMLLKTGYEAAKKADPDCKVLSGAPLTVDFMTKVMEDNANQFYFDVMSVHYLGTSESREGKIARWKAFLKQFGGNSIPLVNTEEMDWKSPDPLKQSSLLIRNYVREAARGISKVFAFDFFRSGSMFGSSGFDYRGDVLPAYAAYRTMTHRLEHAKFVADLSSAETEAYLFDRGGIPVVVVWSDKKRGIELPVGSSSCRAIDFMDVESAAVPKNGILTVSAGPLPQFIEGGDLKLLTAYAGVLKALPLELMLRPGKTAESHFSSELLSGNSKLRLPNAWSGEITAGKLRISVPKTASFGIYDLAVSCVLNGVDVTIPIHAEVSNGVAGENLITNGDFSRGTAYWFYPQDKTRFDAVKGAGVNGGNAVRTKGPVFFGCAGSVKVREGEKYALIAEAKGEGRFGGVVTVKDQNGRLLYPKRQGINCLNNTVGPEWKTFCEEFTVSWPGAADLKFSVLANYGDKKGSEIEFNRLAIVRLTDRFTRNKAVFQGVCKKTPAIPADWSRIPSMTIAAGNRDDLSASCRMAMDAQFLYLRFEVRDDVLVRVDDKVDQAWRFDSIQFAIDPTMEGKDSTELIVAEKNDGKTFVWKYNNFWTPELPGNLVRRGLLPDAKVETGKTPGRIVYTVSIPLRELYPLSDKTKEFGFSWLVNDNDGKGRKYLEWSSGIGGRKQPSEFGLVRVK